MGRYFKIKRDDISFSAVPKKGTISEFLESLKKSKHSDKSDTLKRGTKFSKAYTVGTKGNKCHTLKKRLLRNAKVGNNKDKVRISCK